MKKFFTLFILLALPLICFAEHATFKGIPINGTITSFQKALGKEGFTLADFPENAQNSGVKCFQGKFLNANCYLYVLYDPTTKTVYQARVTYPVRSMESAFNVFPQVVRGVEDQYIVELRASDYNGYPSKEGKIIELDHVIPGRTSLFDNEIEIGWMNIWIHDIEGQYFVVIDILDKANASKFDAYE